MPFLKLAFKKICAIRFGLIPVIMFVLMTIRTLTVGDGIMITGLCAAFLPFFATVRIHVEEEEQYTEVQKIFSTYMVYLFFVTVLLLYLKGLTLLAAEYVPGYVASPIQRELFLLTYVCDISFISIMVPYTCALNSTQKLTLGTLLANLEIGFMFFANKVLLLLGDAFVLHDLWGIYFVAAGIVIVSFSVVLVNRRGMPGENNKTKEIKE